jgi:hypothetical protein
LRRIVDLGSHTTAASAPSPFIDPLAVLNPESHCHKGWFVMPGSRCRQGGHFHGDDPDWGFHGGLVVAVTTVVMETMVATVASGGNGGV